MERLSAIQFASLHFGTVLVPLVVVPGVVVAVPVPVVLVAPAGTFVLPPAGTPVFPPAGTFVFPPATEPPVLETPELRLIPGLSTALGLLDVVPVVVLLVVVPAVLVLLVPAIVPVGTAPVP